MKKMWTLASVVLLFSFAFAAVAAELQSGLKVGDEVGAFEVTDVTGPNKGKSLCYRCSYGSRPVVGLFTRQVDEKLAKLVKELDGVVAENSGKKMAGFVIVMAEDAAKLTPQLEELAKKHDIKNIPLTIYNGKNGPEDYKLSPDANLTVLMWNKGEVKSNTALDKDGLNDKAIESIVADTAVLLK
ncbi:MAG: hypothetical protein U0795_05455 [Pirellulales bacterium]